MQTSNFYIWETWKFSIFWIYKCETTWLAKRGKNTFCLYRRTSFVGYFGTVTRDKKCSGSTKIHLGDPSGYFHLLAIFRKVLFGVLSCRYDQRRGRHKPELVLYFRQSRIKQTWLSQKPPRARIPVYSPPRRLKCLDRSRLRLGFFSFFFFLASSKANENSLDIRTKKYWLNSSIGKLNRNLAPIYNGWMWYLSCGFYVRNPRQWNNYNSWNSLCICVCRLHLL